MAIGNKKTTFKKEDVVASLLSKEMRSKFFEMEKEAFVVHGRSKEKGKKKDKKYKSKSQGRSKSLSKKAKVKCWNCGQPSHVRKD